MKESCGRKARRPGPAYLSTSKPALHHSPISTLWSEMRAHEDKAAPAVSSIGLASMDLPAADQTKVALGNRATVRLSGGHCMGH